MDMCVQKSPLFWYISLKSVFSSHQELGLWWKWRDKLKWEGGEQSGVRTTETDLWLILIRCQSVPGTNITTWLTQQQHRHRHCRVCCVKNLPLLCQYFIFSFIPETILAFEARSKFMCEIMPVCGCQAAMCCSSEILTMAHNHFV